MSAAATLDAQPDPQVPDRSSSPSIIGKRKREDDDSGFNSEQVGARDDGLYSLVEDLLEVLKSAYTFVPAILSRNIVSSARESSSAKRTKLSSDANATSTTSITTQIESKAYTTTEELILDFDLAVDDIIKEFNSGNYISNELGRAPASRSKSIQQARTLQAEVHALLGRERSHNFRKPLTPESSDVSSMANAARQEPYQLSTGNASQSKDVLTICGAGPRDASRQFFAGFDANQQEDSDTISRAVLPNSILSTRVLPRIQDESSKARKHSTLGDLIPSNAAQLKPPQPPSSGVTRSTVVEWYMPSTEQISGRPANKDNYADSKLTQGNWLSYSANANIEESTSEKRLKRDRALSGTEQPNQEEIEYLQQQRNSRARAKKNSLFRSAYSSFAPSHDDTATTVPAQTRSRIWWNRVGEQAYRGYADPEASLTLAQQLDALEVDADEDSQHEVSLDAIFHEAVESYQSEKGSAADDNEATSGVEDLLQEISDSVEGLWLYQQERHKSVGSSGRAASQNPSTAEEALYETMKMQLAFIISQLPPYAVARLNGEKLGKLNVSTALQIPAPSYNGVIEEPEKVQPTPPAPPRAGSSQASLLSRLQQQQAAATPPPRATYQQPRSASATMNQNYQGRVPMPAQYGSQTVQPPARFSQYTQQTTQTTQASNGYRQQPQNGYQSYGQYGATQGANSPAPQRHQNQYTQRPQAGYQPRSQTYQFPTAQKVSPVPNGRSASPHNPSAYSPAQNRSGYSVTQAQPASYGNTNYVRPPSVNAAPVGAMGTIGSLFQLTAEELAMQKQRAQSSGSPPASQQPTPQTPGFQRPPSSNGVVPPAHPSPPPSVQAPAAPMHIGVTNSLDRDGSLDGAEPTATRTLTKACERCRRLHRKCDQAYPCSNCKQSGNSSQCTATADGAITTNYESVAPPGAPTYNNLSTGLSVNANPYDDGQSMMMPAANTASSPYAAITNGSTPFSGMNTASSPYPSLQGEYYFANGDGMGPASNTPSLRGADVPTPGTRLANGKRCSRCKHLHHSCNGERPCNWCVQQKRQHECF